MDLYGNSAYEIQQKINAVLKRTHEAANNPQAPVSEACARPEGLSAPPPLPEATPIVTPGEVLAANASSTSGDAKSEVEQMKDLMEAVVKEARAKRAQEKPAPAPPACAPEDGAAASSMPPIVVPCEVLVARPSSAKVRPISEAKRAANQRNAQRSTGPRTAEGKARSSGNARRHGLLAQQIVIPGESAVDFKQLRRELMEQFAPAGVAEELAVERMLECEWQLRRIRRYEQAVIWHRLQQESSEMTEKRDHVDPVAKAMLEFRHPPNVDDPKEFESVYDWSRQTEPHRQALRQTAAGLDFLGELVQQVRAALERTGSADSQWAKKLFTYFGAQEGGVARLYHQLCGSSVGGADAASQQRLQPVILAALKAESDRLAAERRGVVRRERQRAQVRLAEFSLPEPETMKLILRYQTAIQHRYDRALEQLQHLQRQRRAASLGSSKLRLEPGGKPARNSSIQIVDEG